MADCCLIKKVATVEVYENKNEVRAYGFMAGDRNTPVMEVRFKHLWGESNLSSCKLRWIIVDDVGSLLVGEVPIQSDNTALINLPNELFTGDRRMKVQLTVASCDGERILNLQQFTDLKVINSLAPNEVVEPVYQILINALHDESQKYLKELETSYTQKYGSLDSLYKSARASLEQYLTTAENGGNAEFLQGYAPHNFKKTEDTIANLQASTKYKLGEVVELLGYYTAGDGAGHHRQKKPNGYNGADAVIGADGSIWGIVHNGEINVSWFGAKGDGVTDDTVYFESAVSFAKNLEINIPNGQFNVKKLLKKGFSTNGNVVFTNRQQHLENNKEWSNLTIEKELDMYFSEYQELKTQGYSLYPSGFSFVDELGYVIFQYATLSGDRTKTWHKVCDFKNNYEVISVFSLEGASGSEGLHTFLQGDYIYVATKNNLYRLPKDLKNVHMQNFTKFKDLPPNHQTMTGGFNENLVLEISNNSFGRTREYYDIYSIIDILNETNLTPKGNLKLNLSSINYGKIQGVNLSDDNLYVGCGGLYAFDFNAYTPKIHNYSVRECSVEGDIINEIELDPNKLRQLLAPHIKDSVGIIYCENEGVACSYFTGSKRVFSLMVISDLKVIVLEHNTTHNNSIDVTSAICLSNFSDIKSKQGVCNSEKPINHATGKIMNNLEEIADYMVDNYINDFSFYNSSEVSFAGLKGDVIPLSVYVTIKNFNNFTFFIEYYNNNINKKGVFSGVKGERTMYYQTLKTDTNIIDSTKNNIHVSPVESRINYYIDSSQTKVSSAFYYGDTGSTKVNVGSISHTTTETRYTTSSDPRMKTVFKPHTTVWEDFGKIHDSLGKYTFKHDKEKKEILGFNAHKLIDYGFNAGVEGEGGRELELGEVYSRTLNDSNEVIERYVTPASVDASLLVPYLVTAIKDLKEELEKIKSKIV